MGKHSLDHLTAKMKMLTGNTQNVLPQFEYNSGLNEDVSSSTVLTSKLVRLVIERCSWWAFCWYWIYFCRLLISGAMTVRVSTETWSFSPATFSSLSSVLVHRRWVPHKFIDRKSGQDAGRSRLKVAEWSSECVCPCGWNVQTMEGLVIRTESETNNHGLYPTEQTVSCAFA